MPNVGPQFESPGEKEDKPEKAERNTDTAGEVPDSLKERKGVEEVENEEWPKEYEISVEIDGEQVEIPVKETKIEFPDYIVEDTGGVTGYIRKEISWDDYDNAFPDSEYAKSGNYFDTLEEVNHKIALNTDPSDIFRAELEEALMLDKFNDAKKRYEEWKRKRDNDELTKEDREKYKKQREKAFDLEKTKEEIEEKLYSTLFRPGSVLERLTNDKFLKKTANHVKNVYSGMDNNKEQFTKNKLYLQKLFDPDTLSEHLERDEKVYMHSNSLTVRSVHSNKVLSEISKQEKPDKLADFPDTFGSSKISVRKAGNKEDVIDALQYIKNSDDFYFESDWSIRGYHGGRSRGLSVEKRGGYWWNDSPHRSRLPNMDDVIFGFGPWNEAFVEYLNEIKELREQVSLSDDEVDEFTNKNIKHLLNPEVESYGGPFEDYHPHIPVYNSHPDIPSLRWCHASYAYLPTDRGFNVLEFISKENEDEGS